MDYLGRLGRTRHRLGAARLQALVVSHLPNVRYLCGFTGTAGVLICGPSESVFFTDGRYREQARKEVRGAQIKIRPAKSALASAAEWLGQNNSYARIGIEAAHLSVAERNLLAGVLGKRQRLIEAPPLVDELRMVKERAELPLLREACRVTSQLFRGLIKVIRAGVSEAEVAGEVEFAARQAGAEQMAFPTIIAAGPRSALPHGRASRASIPARGFVVCDFGVILAGYCSDMTRTVHVGKPSVAGRDLYEAVREAQQAALAAVKPGESVGEVDQSARKLLQRRNLAKFFTHSTGHGVGLEIHESPRIAAGQTDELRPGMVITVEPGVYMPGKWGVRIEDTVVVTDSGCEVLTTSPKELIAL
ncbi:MAG: aminopeptidase P family protein [Acidobacteria bacterium]|nr:aminopeptidase P family protein [Acidobacteriota bacterium]